MKKIFSIVMASVLACGAVSSQSLKLVNTFGGDSDSTGGSDLFTFENQKDDDDSYKDQFGNKTRVSNRLQLDASEEKFDARLRMETASTKLNGKESTIRFRGYGRFKPVEQFQFIAGNDFFTKVTVDAGYLAASDDTPKYARILQNGFGAVSNWKLGEEKNVNLKLAAGCKGTDDSFMNKDTFGLDAGFNFGIKDTVTVGGSFQNVTGENLSATVFAGLSSVENLTLNAGYLYNVTDTDFIAKSCKNAVSVSAAYNFKDSGILAALDIVSGLSNEYIKNGETKKYEEDGKKLTPLFADARVSYEATENLNISAEAKVYLMAGDNDSLKTEIYPNVAYKLPNKMGTLTAGVRVNLEKDELAKFAVPFTWKCTLADIKK